jgi:hypothetical protein
MGASVSSNVSKIVINAIAKISSKIIMKEKITANAEQIISISDVNGNVDISDNIMTQRVSLNMHALLTALSTSQAQQALATELSQQAKSLTSGLNVAQFSDASNIMNSLITASIDVMSNIEQSCSISSTEKQTLIVERIHGNVNIVNNTQEQIAQILTNCVESAVNNSQSISDVKEKLDQSASATSKGLNGFIIVAILAVIVGVPVVGGTVLVKNIFPIMLIVGIIFIVLYFMKSSETISMTAYSTFINQNCSEAKQIDNSNEYNKIQDASDYCLENSECIAFDWDEIRFYSHVNSDCQFNIKKDNTTMVNKKGVRVGNGEPTVKDVDIPGCIYVDLDTSDTFQLSQKRVFVNTGRLLPIPFSKLIFIKSKPNLEGLLGKYGEFCLYIDSFFNIYEYDDGWIEYTKIKIPLIDANVPTKTNGSGFKIKNRENKYLYIGILAIILGIVGLIVKRDK